MKNLVIIYVSPQSLYLEKFRFSSYGLKYSWPIRSQESVILKKESRDQVYLSNTDKHQNFLQVDTTAYGGRG